MPQAFVTDFRHLNFTDKLFFDVLGDTRPSTRKNVDSTANIAQYLASGLPGTALPIRTSAMRLTPRQEAGHQMQYMGDTKAGTYIASDSFGNKYYENMEEELPLRTRWVDYKDKNFDPSQIEPGWHAWMSYMVHEPPTNDPILQRRQRVWEPKQHYPNLTASRASFRTYNTTAPKHRAWTPVAESRG